MANTHQKLINRIRERAYPLEGGDADYLPLLQRIGDARFVLLGEATHGTHDFYAARAEITKRLIQEKGFSIVALEADWPDTYQTNRYVHSSSKDTTGTDALSGFLRFPSWMWRNRVTRDFVEWLKEYNQSLPQPAAKVGVYGLDLYSLRSSTEAVIAYLEEVDPEAAKRARYRYSCFDHFGEDPQAYGYAAGFDLTATCEQEVIDQLMDLRRKAFAYVKREGFVRGDEYFYAEQNARIAKNAEAYYRTMFAGRAAAWNLRDHHMLETLQALVEHRESQGLSPKVVVWAHNTHIGDARATEMADQGELNLGQLTRQHYGYDSVLVGFTTYTGTVTAASDWGLPAERKNLPSALAGSFEALFHYTDLPRFFLILDTGQEDLADLKSTRLERAIGTVYRPETERISHYFNARLMDQFNMVFHFDVTRALEPLERFQVGEAGEAPLTFPSGV